MRWRSAALIAIAVTFLAVSGTAQESSAAPVDPETCLVSTGIDVEHGGKRYVLRDAACRDLFLSDPERYAQLFDALQELAAAGKPVQPPPRRASLVPS